MPSRFEREAENEELSSRPRVIAATAREANQAVIAELLADPEERVPARKDPVRERLLQELQLPEKSESEESEGEVEIENIGEREDEGDDEEGEDEVQLVSQNKRGRTAGSGRFGIGRSWVYLPQIVALVPVDRTMLSPAALVHLSAHPRTDMLQCLHEPAVSTVRSQQHYSGFLSVGKGSNLKNHFKSFHPNLFSWMETAQKNGEDLPTAYANFLIAQPRRMSTSKSQSKITNFANKTNADGSLQLGARKEVAFVLDMIASDSSFNYADSSVTRICNQVRNFTSPGAEAVAARVSLISRAVRDIRHSQLSVCQFFSTTMDFATICSSSFLLITYHAISPTWDKIVNIGLDVLQFPGATYSTNVAIAAKLRVDSHSSDDCVLVNSTTDGAADIKKASLILSGDLNLLDSDEYTVEELLDELDTLGNAGLCMAHGEHLIVSSVLGSKGQLGSAKVVSRDLLFIHNLAVFFATYEKQLRLFSDIQKQSGDGIAIDVLGIHCDTRWNDRYLAVQRFIRLRKALTIWYLHDNCAYKVGDDLNAPNDAFLESFWDRLFGTERVLAVFFQWSTTFQTEKAIVASFLPRAVFELRKACFAVEEGVNVKGDVAAVRDLKTELLAGVEKYLAYPLQKVSNPLKAALMDPNEAKLSFYGVKAEVIEDTWKSLEAEVKIYTPGLADHFDKCAPKLRKELEELSAKVQAGGARIDMLRSGKLSRSSRLSLVWKV
jgi:hypothetical protein